MAYGILAYNNTGKILISTDIQGLHFAGIAILSSTVQSLTRNFPNYNRDGYYLSGS
jgi:tRNA G10  N-methylase Trm11